MKKKIGLLVMLIAVMAIAAGCNQTNQPITSQSTGIWNEYFVYPLSQLITYFAKLFGNNYGLAIVVTTLIIRFALLPLMIKQTKSTKAMQVLQPEMAKLKEKYSSKDQATQQKLQQEMMQLYQKHGINPLAGCLPIFIQMPILFAFYHAIIRTSEIKQHSFLWFDLGHADPYYILPIVAAITTFIQQKLAMAGTAGQNPQMAMMLWLMPIMILVFAINFPAALSLYWVVGNIFGIAQTYLIKGPDLKASKAGGSSK
ncbi:YidC family membrane integrase SpoIIIJ [Bacillus sp. NPDC077411]|uniref:YidC family membrane integrase SpoIIIJ n=1 Tax=unclassified Bacillus (in: firmicutes) TaxID=185979 RepID=UPI0008EBDD3B|nr:MULTISPECIES: YidC family membrane integrase SpoIIIJ [unclassified Bacillus (in: firmicutes)]SFJ23086.1 protein translocase subunit yidC [Bacillus sp. 71mf]SFT12144.1 protein translocase subunit yidC [Bacillus sp. 103mf]